MVEFTLFIFGSGIGASHPVLQRNFQSIKVRLTPHATYFVRFCSGIGASHPVLQRNFQSIKVRLTPLRYWDENNIP